MMVDNKQDDKGKGKCTGIRRSSSRDRSRMGVGAIIAGVFLVGIVGTTLLIYFLSIAQAQQERSKAEMEAQNLKNEALMENYKVLTDVELVDNNKIKYTIVNNGALPISVKSIVVSDVINGNKPVEMEIFDDSNMLILNGGAIYQDVTNPIDTSLLNQCPLEGDVKCYRIDVVSERGNVQSATYPPEMVAFAKKAGEAEKSKDSQSAAEAALAQQTGSVLLNFNSFGAIFPNFSSNLGGVDQRGWDVRIDEGVGYPAFRLIDSSGPSGQQFKGVYLALTVKNKDPSGSDIKLNHYSTVVLYSGGAGGGSSSVTAESVYICAADINKTVSYPLTLRIEQGSLAIGSKVFQAGSVFKASTGTLLQASSNATLDNTAKTITYPSSGTSTLAVTSGSLFIDSTTYSANANPVFTASANTVLKVSTNATLNNSNKQVTYPAPGTLTLTVTSGSLKIGSDTYSANPNPSLNPVFTASANTLLEVTSDAALSGTTVTYPSTGGTLTILNGSLTIGGKTYTPRDLFLASPDTVLQASSNATLDNTAKSVAPYNNNNPIILPNVKDSTDPDEGWVTLVFCDTVLDTGGGANFKQEFNPSASNVNFLFLILRGEMSNGTPYAQTIPYQAVLIPSGSFTASLNNYTGAPGSQRTITISGGTSPYSIYWIYPDDGVSRLLGTISSGTSTNITIPSDAERGRFYAIQVQDVNERVYYLTFKVV
ncbi:MAG: hypothetical protein QW383_01000 [Candidatus Nitrosocaldus sp.]